MRSVSRLADVSIKTVSKLLVDAGKACATFHDDTVRGVKSKLVQCDESWSFTAAKQKNVLAMKAKKMKVEGSPDPKHVFTSYVERQNLTMRMHMRRFTRLTNAFSKSLRTTPHGCALCRVVQLRSGPQIAPRVPAMAAGISDRLWNMEDLAALVEAADAKPGKRGTYKTRGEL